MKRSSKKKSPPAKGAGASEPEKLQMLEHRLISTIGSSLYAGASRGCAMIGVAALERIVELLDAAAANPRLASVPAGISRRLKCKQVTILPNARGSSEKGHPRCASGPQRHKHARGRGSIPRQRCEA